MEQATLSYCEGTTTKDKADDSRLRNTTLRVDEGFGTRVVFETLSNEETSIVEACVIEGDNGCDGYMTEEIVKKNLM